MPAELILARKNLPLTTSPWESNRIGCPRIEVGSFVFLIAASTLARLGVCPDLHTAAIASSITCVAAKVGGTFGGALNPRAVAAAEIALSAGILVMSAPNMDTYEPGIVNAPGANRLSAQRPLLEADQTVPGLCEGVIATAERLRHLAWHAAEQSPGSPGLTVTSARQAAETSTVTAHNCALIARTLAAASHGVPPAIGADLAAADGAARQASGSWYQIARALRQVTTDTRGHLSPAAAEARDLALWTGRLAYADPTWTPASGPHHPTRPPLELAARPSDVPQVVAAIHHAGEALALLAETEHGQLRAAAHAGRILVPTRTLPDDYNIPAPTPPPCQNTPARCWPATAMPATPVARQPPRSAAPPTPPLRPAAR
jgi:hypothetical protein